MHNASLSFWGLIWQADFLVQMILLGLFIVSIGSWSIMFRKRALFKSAENIWAQFEKAFWSGQSLTALYHQYCKNTQCGISVFLDGFKAYLKTDKAPMDLDSRLLSVERAMRVSHIECMETLDDKLSILATIGSVAPYVGLFGTVWGIMNAFIALGTVSQATLSMVAPGISEALIATAMGLFAAIPAVVAYNRFATRSDRFARKLENFQDTFIDILDRQSHAQ